MSHPRSASRHEGHKMSSLHHTHLAVSVRLRRRGHFHLVRDVSVSCPSISTCPCDTQIQLACPILQESSCLLPLITANPLSSRGTEQSYDSRHRYEHGWGYTVRHLVTADPCLPLSSRPSLSSPFSFRTVTLRKMDR